MRASRTRNHRTRRRSRMTRRVDAGVWSLQTWRVRGAAGLPWARPRGRKLDEGVRGRAEPEIRRTDADAVVTGRTRCQRWRRAAEHAST
jgi:hypothetical protein